LGVNCDAEGRHQTFDFHNATVFDPSAGEVKQLVTRAIGNPDVTVPRDTDAHQSE